MRKKIKKEKKAFTLMLIPHSEGKVRQITISRSGFFLILLGVAVFFALLSSSINDYRQVRSKEARLHKLERVNKAQEEKILSLVQEIEGFSEKMEELKELEDKLRILAGVGGGSETEEEKLGKGGPENYLLLEKEIELDKGRSLSTNLIGKIEKNVVFLKNEIKRREKSLGELEEVVREKIDLFASTPNIFPVQGWISSGYGWRRNPFTGKKEFHQAIDIVAPWGTEIKAAARGKVIFAEWKGAYGLMVRINDGHGYYTVYGHLSHILVKKGQWVEKGDIIGRIGSSGRSTGPHLHFEVWLDGKTVNPLNLMVEPLG